MKFYYDAIRELSRGEQQAAWTEGVSKGDTLKIGGKSYTVQSNSDKLLRLKREDGKIFSFKKYGKSRTFAAEGKEADLFRKVEGDLTRDLLAQYNQFHTPSDVFNLTRRVIEARNNPMYGKPEVKAAAKSEVKSGELIPTQPEVEKVQAPKSETPKAEASAFKIGDYVVPT